MHAESVGTLPAGAKGTSSWLYGTADQVLGAHAYECVLDTENAIREAN